MQGLALCSALMARTSLAWDTMVFGACKDKQMQCRLYLGWCGCGNSLCCKQHLMMHVILIVTHTACHSPYNNLMMLDILKACTSLMSKDARSWFSARTMALGADFHVVCARMSWWVDTGKSNMDIVLQLKHKEGMWHNFVFGSMTHHFGKTHAG